MSWHWSGCWYQEFRNHVRFHDYFNIMINNFPIITLRRFDFGLHEEKLRSTYSLGLCGLTLTW